jgi:hypothetical protein
LLQRRREREEKKKFDRYKVEYLPSDGQESSEGLFVFEEAITVNDVVEALDVRPLCLEYSVRDEITIQLAAAGPRLVDGAQRLRLLFSSTSVVLPGVTFAGTSTRLEDTVGLLLRENEVGSFRTIPRDYFPFPQGIKGSRRTRILEEVDCFPAEDTVWPLLKLTAITHSLLHLSKMIAQHLPELILREWLLRDLEEPSLSSSQFKALAKTYLESGRPIPRTSFLEMSLQMFGDDGPSGLRLPTESKDLPSHVAVTRTPLPLFESLDIIVLTLALLDLPEKTQVERYLSSTLLSQLDRYAQTNEETDGFQSVMLKLCETDEAKRLFGSAQCMRTTGFTLVERLLASEKPKSVAELTPGLAQLYCKRLANKAPDWFSMALLLSQLEERSTQAKLRRLARLDPRRLANLLECSLVEPLPKYFTPLEKLSIFCDSLDESSGRLRTSLSHYFPRLPAVRYSPSEAHDVQLEMLRRTRYWATRGFRVFDLEMWGAERN